LHDERRNLQKLYYNGCHPFCMQPIPVTLSAMGLLSVENFSETKLGRIYGYIKNSLISEGVYYQ